MTIATQQGYVFEYPGNLCRSLHSTPTPPPQVLSLLIEDYHLQAEQVQSSLRGEHSETCIARNGFDSRGQRREQVPVQCSFFFTSPSPVCTPLPAAEVLHFRNPINVHCKVLNFSNGSDLPYAHGVASFPPGDTKHRWKC